MIRPGWSWYERMNQRERILAMIVVGALFVLVNVFIWSWLFGAIGRARTEFATRKDARKQQIVYVQERSLWMKRAEWMQQHQPVIGDPGEASKLLEEQVRPVANKYKILLENPQIGSGETTPNHQTVFATFDTKSEWRPLIQFLYDIQQPEAFIVFETVNLSVDSTEPSMMRGRFKVARWFSPAQPKG
jgi:hypothetical protein